MKKLNKTIKLSACLLMITSFTNGNTNTGDSILKAGNSIKNATETSITSEDADNIVTDIKLAYENGDKEVAKKLTEKYAELIAQKTSLFYYLVELTYKYGDKKVANELAEKYAELIAQDGPNGPHYFTQLVELAYKNGYNELAQELTEKYAELIAQKNPYDFIDLVDLAYKYGDKKVAKELTEKWAELIAQNSPYSLYDLIKLAYKNGYNDFAKELTEKYAELIAQHNFYKFNDLVELTYKYDYKELAKELTEKSAELIAQNSPYSLCDLIKLAYKNGDKELAKNLTKKWTGLLVISNPILFFELMEFYYTHDEKDYLISLWNKYLEEEIYIHHKFDSFYFQRFTYSKEQDFIIMLCISILKHHFNTISTNNRNNVIPLIRGIHKDNLDLLTKIKPELTLKLQAIVDPSILQTSLNFIYEYSYQIIALIHLASISLYTYAKFPIIQNTLKRTNFARWTPDMVLKVILALEKKIIDNVYSNFNSLMDLASIEDNTELAQRLFNLIYRQQFNLINTGAIFEHINILYNEYQDGVKETTDEITGNNFAGGIVAEYL